MYFLLYLRGTAVGIPRAKKNCELTPGHHSNQTIPHIVEFIQLLALWLHSFVRKSDN